MIGLFERDKIFLLFYNYIIGQSKSEHYNKILGNCKYICVHSLKLNKLNEEENETATISNFLHLFTLHVILLLLLLLLRLLLLLLLKTITLKIKMKASTEAQSEGHALVLAHKTSESHLADWRKTNQKRCSIGSKRFWRLQLNCTWKNCMVNVIPLLWLSIQKWKQ